MNSQKFRKVLPILWFMLSIVYFMAYIYRGHVLSLGIAFYFFGGGLIMAGDNILIFGQEKLIKHQNKFINRIMKIVDEEEVKDGKSSKNTH